MLNIDDLKYSYRHDGMTNTYQYSLNVEPGEVIGILGESGSGKSTLLDLISGFLHPDDGTIMLDGTIINNIPPEKRPVTILFQNHNLFEHLTAIENLLIGLHGDTKGTEEERKRAISTLVNLGISDQVDKVVTKLSGGQQQRVALGRALLRDRPILLLDEPFTGLDPETRADVLRLVRSITTERGLYTIMVTHDRGDCEMIADSVYKMKSGKLLVEIPAEAGR